MALMEEGQYLGTLEDIGDDCLNTVKKTPFIYVMWKVTHRAIAGADGQPEWKLLPEPASRKSRWWATKDAEPHTMKRLERLGFNGDLDNPQFTADPHPVRDGVELVCRQRPNEGKVYEDWDLAGGKERTPWDDDARRAFKAKYRNTCAVPAASPPAPKAAEPAAPAREPDNSPVRDDEVPGETAPAQTVAEKAGVPDDEIPF